MKRPLSLIILVLTIGAAFAQEPDPILIAYQRRFVRSSLEDKLSVLSDAGKDPSLLMDPSKLGSVYGLALDFILQNAELLRDDPNLVRMASIAARGVGSVSHTKSIASLWRLFMAFRDTSVRVAALNSLGRLGKGDGQVVENLNQFLANQNNVYRSGMAPDLEILLACVDALANLGDASSFSPLFSIMLADYPDRLRSQVTDALKNLKGDYKKFLIDMVRKNPPLEKIAAFKTGMANEVFTFAERGELAEAALEISLAMHSGNDSEVAALDEMRYTAVRTLTSLRWSRGSSLTVKHFYRVQTDFGKELVSKGVFLEAIAALGAMSSSEAAQALSLYLGLVNSDMERSKGYDREILLAVISALGELGDKVAFDYLLYIGYLSYPDEIKTAARESMNRLKW